MMPAAASVQSGAAKRALDRITELYGDPISVASPYEKRAAQDLARCIAKDSQDSAAWVETYVLLLAAAYRMSDFPRSRPQADQKQRAAKKVSRNAASEGATA